MKKISGNVIGLKVNQVKRLENIYRRKIPPNDIITPELARYITELSREINRQIGILVKRSGDIEYVMVGDHRSITIPSLSDYRAGSSRLRGLRCIHTHLDDEPLTHDDLTDLALLRLDIMAGIIARPDGLPGLVHAAHLLPRPVRGENIFFLEPRIPAQLDIDFQGLIQSLEDEIAREQAVQTVGGKKDRAFLIDVTTTSREAAEESLEELRELARTAGVEVLDSIIQRRDKIHPKYIMGKGKLGDLLIKTLQRGANLLIFDHELNPSQIRSITDFTDMRVIDRTQLILDIFARRARSREGKIQVEMAQLNYLLPRLVTRDDALSRLTGGIGGRGPGETRLEIDRRRVRERIARLTKELKSISKQRELRRKIRKRKDIPIISIVGYTNAGKSTLLNALTKSQFLAEDRLFATLDPASRRIRFPREAEAIITDTVGFIRDLPRDLFEAFRATLEELQDADIIIHLIDISNKNFREHIEAVEHIMETLELHHIPAIKVFNKIDRVSPEYVATQGRAYNALAISAMNPDTLSPFIETIQGIVEKAHTQVKEI
ncbi:MAG: GTPase HflX [Deltaproteobacteria bacterium]|nr:MAG: GTPase HflX [Deltaproteobacteria bacterium]